jgi:HEAT repeat protein
MQLRADRSAQPFSIMNDCQWQEIVAALRDTGDSDTAVNAAATLQAKATQEDVPRLLELLSDGDFLVREAAAWPLARILKHQN